MGFKKIVKKGLFSGLNPLRWVGYEHIVQNGKTIKDMVGNFIKSKPSAIRFPETFEQCMQRFGLTEEGLKKRMRASLQIAVTCLALSIAMLSYTIYLFAHQMPLSAFVCVILTLLLLAYAFREHFNYFQMKQRRLGCTFKEWFAATIRRKK